MTQVLTEISDEQYTQLAFLAFKKEMKIGDLCREIFATALAEAGTNRETITWITDGTLPDDGISVLICTDVGDVGEACHEDDAWQWVGADFQIGDNRIKAWANLPEGPKP